MKRVSSMDKVQLIFPTDPLDRQVVEILKKGVFAGGDHIGFLQTPSGGREGVEPDEFLEEMGKLNIIGINFGKLMNAFKGLKIDQIELWVSAAVETEGILKLAVSAKGEGGVKIVLKPGA